MKNIKRFFYMFIFLYVFFIPINKTFANSILDNSIDYYNEQEEHLNRIQKDEITNYGQLLTIKGINLIVNTRIQNNKSGNEECKDIFYNYMKKNGNTNKVIVAIYYTDNKEFQFYDDYGILTKKTLEDTSSYIKKFHSNDKIGEGIVFIYKTLSKEINNKEDLKIVQLDDLEINNPYKHSIFSIRNFVLLVIIFVLILGFRRNKNMSIT